MKHQQQQQQQHLVYEATNSSDNNTTNTNTNTNTNTKLLKERHIVTWTQQEDDILREQINTHGTENWAIIASKFKDKTTRQCRRRWYTYLNSDFKKGGWSPEEDMILCEAQKIFGNRWTEIAKVVSGRTDNAVKNRFSTLCKKRAKHETLTKENKSSCINSNNKRIIFQNGFVTDDKSESAAPLKKMRTHNTDAAENCNLKGRLLGDCGKMENEQLRHPFTVLIQNSPNVCELPAQQHIRTTTTSTSTASNDVGKHKDQGTFIKRDDPKIIALMKQAELLSSLALKVNTENNSQSLENAWKELQEFLNRTHERELLRCNVSVTEFPLEEFKDLVEELKCSAIGNQLYWRQPDLHEESPGSSEYSTGSTAQSNTVGENTEQPQAEVCSLPQCIEPQSVHMLVENSCGGEDGLTSTSVIDVGLPIIPMEGKNGGDCGCADGLAGVIDVGPPLIHMEAKNKDDVGFSDGFHIIGTTAEQVVILPSSDEPKGNGVPALSNRTFSSPIQVTPVFQTFASTIPSPKFSESERNFLMKTLGSTALSPNPSINFSQPPPCKRALLHSL